jgi:hypothetical protein
MGGLVGSSVEEPFRVGKIVENLRLGQKVLTVRTETVQETLTHLIAEGKAKHTTLGKRHVYYLTEKAHAELSPVVSSADADFSAAIERMLKDTGHLVDFDKAIKICRRFVLECFARFGRVLAKTVTGHARPDELPRVIDTRDAFKAAVEQYRFSPEALESE